MSPRGRPAIDGRESDLVITVSQFVYRAVSYRDLASIEEGTRFKAEKWDGAHTYREWLSLLGSWRAADQLESGQ